MRPLAQTLATLVLPVVHLHLLLCSGMAAPGKAGASQGTDLRSVLPFSHDDYPQARARAQRESKLLIVEAWATWCHTCQSMRHFVFTDLLLRPVADRFVFVALDTDRPVNARFVERYPIASWPTLLALDPGQSATPLRDERVLARFTGALTAAELLGRLGALNARPSGAAQVLAHADAEAAEQKWDTAAALYAEAARQTVVDRPRALLGEIQALREKNDYVGCVQLVDTSLAATGNGAPATDFASYAATCLDHLTDVDRRQRLRQRLRAHLHSLVEDLNAPLSVDDRSDAFGSLIELSDALGDRPAGDRYAEARLRLLEAAAYAAKTPTDAATFDSHRLESYRRLRRYDAAEKMLLTSLRALPGDFNPPARLSKLYVDMGRLDDALFYINEAIGKSYGPRKATLLEQQAHIRHGLGQTREAVQSLLAAIAVMESQPNRNEHRLALLRKQIAALQSTLHAPPQQKAAPGQSQPSQPQSDSPAAQHPVAAGGTAQRHYQARR